MKMLSSSLLLLAGVAMLIGCSTAEKTKTGDRVRLAYVGTLDDGTVFDSTSSAESIEFVIGGGQVIPGIENAVIGMSKGEKKSVSLPPDQAYGPHRPELVHTYPADSFPPDVTREIGGQIDMQTPDGRTVRLIVTGVDAEGNVTVDANHQLAGKTLNFDLTLVEILEVAGKED